MTRPPLNVNANGNSVNRTATTSVEVRAFRSCWRRVQRPLLRRRRRRRRGRQPQRRIVLRGLHLARYRSGSPASERFRRVPSCPTTGLSRQVGRVRRSPRHPWVTCIVQLLRPGYSPGVRRAPPSISTRARCTSLLAAVSERFRGAAAISAYGIACVCAHQHGGAVASGSRCSAARTSAGSSLRGRRRSAGPGPGSNETSACPSRATVLPVAPPLLRGTDSARSRTGIPSPSTRSTRARACQSRTNVSETMSSARACVTRQEEREPVARRAHGLGRDPGTTFRRLCRCRSSR